MPSGQVKVLPWYYTERRQPSRAHDNTNAINDDLTANEPHDCEREGCGGDAPADWVAQEYEDAYWSERVAVSTWSPETAAMFLDAVAMRAASRTAAKADVCAELLTHAPAPQN